jgi:hypothetical protein
LLQQHTNHSSVPNGWIKMTPTRKKPSKLKFTLS